MKGIHKFTYAMIESSVDNALKGLLENNYQETQKLLNLGSTFMKGDYLKKLYKDISIQLQNKNSPYHALINDLVHSVNHNTIKRFGINLFYNSLSIGTSIIQNQEKILQCYIPWYLIFDFKPNMNKVLSIHEINSIINHGENNGIYFYLFFIDNETLFIEKLIEIGANHLDSAFLFFMNSNQINEKLLINIEKSSNIAVSINYYEGLEEKSYFSVINLIRKYHCLFGAHSFINKTNITNIISNNYRNNFGKFRFSYHILIQEDELENKKRYSQYINTLKNAHKFPFLIIDFYSDLSYVDQLISNHDSLIAFSSNGDINYKNMKNKHLESSARKQSLEHNLKLIYPKINQ